MGSKEQDGILGVGDGIFGCTVLECLCAIFHGGRDHAPGGEVMAVGDKLGGCCDIPKPSMEKDDHRATVDFVVEVGRKEEVRLQISSRSLFVDV